MCDAENDKRQINEWNVCNLHEEEFFYINPAWFLDQLHSANPLYDCTNNEISRSHKCCFGMTATDTMTRDSGALTVDTVVGLTQLDTLMVIKKHKLSIRLSLLNHPNRLFSHSLSLFNNTHGPLPFIRVLSNWFPIFVALRCSAH